MRITCRAVAPRLSLRLGQTGAYGNLDVRRRLGFASAAEGANASDEEGLRAYWGGSTRLGALYQLAEERGALPAMGLLGRARMIYGPGRPAYETDLAALFGKTFAAHAGPPLGVNLVSSLLWLHCASRPLVVRPFVQTPHHAATRPYPSAAVGVMFVKRLPAPMSES